ncbi:agmatine deiminase family protein [Nocardia sp. SYP-A9097]|uniref:agmatine deiminase family protein n=1 Tax=Nocardia sp. SYP-A9097 TaxID=2663237 RepID=UPI00129A7CF5|nr:agmatine deiminase family protein [Nocardia sp. SYP-A9097]MRH88673.1 agmatine deiminase family protein [Nocardia sp. SYP-A9097]
MTEWRMPAEHSAHRRTWMAFPPAGSEITATQDATDEARAAWTAVAHAVAEFEPVTMVVDPADVRDAKLILSGAVDILEAPLDDAWMRDIGPTFVHAADGSVAAVDWVFNGWGQQDWARWGNDGKIGKMVAAAAGVPVIDSPLVNEGGGIQVDGAGTVLLTETVQLDPFRNPGLSKADVENELRRTIGIDTAIWLPRGLWRDSQRFGTRGHADIVAALPSPGVVLVHDQRDPEHPDYELSRELVQQFESEISCTGKPFEVIPVPAPRTLRDEEGFVDYSYINHYVCNNAVILCGFDDANDAEAAEIMSLAYPGRAIVTVDAREIFARGGGIHCITQNEPLPAR